MRYVYNVCLAHVRRHQCVGYVQGHSKPITALAVTEDKGTVFTASSDGNVCILAQWLDGFSGKSFSKGNICIHICWVLVTVFDLLSVHGLISVHPQV